ncbi:MAG: addiction module protein [candidate division NC10 bacterium]|nr:addiction module protein [candidate division NC10 bacterium]MDE2321062.1 addiction module protein [candidate division NC10 bacterium]
MGPALRLDKMTVRDKLQALEEIWDDLCRSAKMIPSPSWHADVLRAREKRIRQGTSRFTEWTEAKQKIRRRTR